MVLTAFSDLVQFCGWVSPSGCLAWASKSTSHAPLLCGLKSSHSLLKELALVSFISQVSWDRDVAVQTFTDN